MANTSKRPNFVGAGTKSNFAKNLSVLADVKNGCRFIETRFGCYYVRKSALNHNFLNKKCLRTMKCFRDPV